MAEFLIKSLIKLQNDSIAATATGHFSIIPAFKLKNMTKDYPQLANQWMNYPD